MIPTNKYCTTVSVEAAVLQGVMPASPLNKFKPFVPDNANIVLVQTDTGNIRFGSFSNYLIIYSL